MWWRGIFYTYWLFPVQWLCSGFSVTTHWFVLTTNMKSQSLRMVKTWARSDQGVPTSSYFPFQHPKIASNYLPIKSTLLCLVLKVLEKLPPLSLSVLPPSVPRLPCLFCPLATPSYCSSSGRQALYSLKSCLLYKSSMTIPTHTAFPFSKFLRYSQSYSLALNQSEYFMCTSLSSSIFLQAPCDRALSLASSLGWDGDYMKKGI